MVRSSPERALVELTEAVSAAAPPHQVLRLAAATLVTVCPRATAGAYAVADWPARHLLGMATVGAGGPIPAAERNFLDVFATTTLAYGRDVVEARQRDRWLDPFALVGANGPRFAATPTYQAVLAPLGLWHHDRRVYCVGGRPIAYASAALPEDDRAGFSARERRELATAAERLAAPLRHLAATAGTVARAEALDHLLASHAAPCLVLAATGRVVARSPSAAALELDAPEVRAHAAELVRRRPRVAASAAVGRHRISVAPCAERGAPLAWLVLVESGPSVGGLTERQREIATLAARGATNAEIARRLGIGEGTVKKHLERVFRHLGIRRRPQLVRHLG